MNDTRRAAAPSRNSSRGHTPTQRSTRAVESRTAGRHTGRETSVSCPLARSPSRTAEGRTSGTATKATTTVEGRLLFDCLKHKNRPCR